MSKQYVYLGQYYHKHGKDLQELGRLLRRKLVKLSTLRVGKEV